MFRSATDHHQGAHFFLVKITDDDQLLIETCQGVFKCF
jgi:hypothetical protein